MKSAALFFVFIVCDLCNVCDVKNVAVFVCGGWVGGTCAMRVL